VKLILKHLTGGLRNFVYITTLFVKQVCGVSRSFEFDAVDDWNSKLVEMFEGLVPKYIFNLDETGLFYSMLYSIKQCVSKARTAAAEKFKRTNYSYVVY